MTPNEQEVAGLAIARAEQILQDYGHQLRCWKTKFGSDNKHPVVFHPTPLICNGHIWAHELGHHKGT